jgi:DNA mismatch repair protein MutL
MLAAGSGARLIDSSRWRPLYTPSSPQFSLQASVLSPVNEPFRFGVDGIAVEGTAALAVARMPLEVVPGDRCTPPIPDESEAAGDLTPALASLKPLGQIRESFILAVNGEGLWIVDQHVAHERVLFEKILKQRAAQKVESQRLLMPLVLELTPAQEAIFREISDELNLNGFEAEPFGARSIAVKVAPAGIEAPRLRPLSPATPRLRSICRSSKLRWSGCSPNYRKPNVPCPVPTGGR